MNKYVLSILYCLLISVCHPHLEKSARRPTKLLRTPWVRNWKPCRQWVQLTCWCHRTSLVSSGCLELQDEWYKLELIRLIDEKKNNQEYLKRKSCERCSTQAYKAQGNAEKTKPSSTGTYSIDREKRNKSKKQPGIFGSKMRSPFHTFGAHLYHMPSAAASKLSAQDSKLDPASFPRILTKFAALRLGPTLRLPFLLSVSLPASVIWIDVISEEWQATGTAFVVLKQHPSKCLMLQWTLHASISSMCPLDIHLHGPHQFSFVCWQMSTLKLHTFRPCPMPCLKQFERTSLHTREGQSFKGQVAWQVPTLFPGSLQPMQRAPSCCNRLWHA